VVQLTSSRILFHEEYLEAEMWHTMPLANLKTNSTESEVLLHFFLRFQ